MKRSDDSLDIRVGRRNAIVEVGARVFAGARALFKLYVTRNIARDDEPIETDPSLDFLKAFIPELNKTLFDKPSSESLSSSP